MTTEPPATPSPSYIPLNGIFHHDSSMHQKKLRSWKICHSEYTKFFLYIVHVIKAIMSGMCDFTVNWQIAHVLAVISILVDITTRKSQIIYLNSIHYYSNWRSKTINSLQRFWAKQVPTDINHSCQCCFYSSLQPTNMLADRAVAESEMQSLVKSIYIRLDFQFSFLPPVNSHRSRQNCSHTASILKWITFTEVISSSVKILLKVVPNWQYVSIGFRYGFTKNF